LIQEFVKADLSIIDKYESKTFMYHEIELLQYYGDEPLVHCSVVLKTAARVRNETVSVGLLVHPHKLEDKNQIREHLKCMGEILEPLFRKQ